MALDERLILAQIMQSITIRSFPDITLSAQRLFEAAFPRTCVSVGAFGNVLAATSLRR